MKFKKIICFSLIFVFLFSLSFSVLAQRGTVTEAAEQAERVTLQMSNTINNVLAWLFGVTDFALKEIVLYVAVFLILLLMFRDVLINFSPLSNWTAGAVAFLLVMIISVMKGIFALATLMFTVTALFGVYSIVISLGLSFGAYLLFHKALYALFREYMIKGKKKDIWAGMKLFKEAGEELRKK